MKHRSMHQKWRRVSSTERYNLYQSEADPCRFRIRLRKSGNYVRRVFSAASIEEAIAQAPVMGGLVSAKKTAEQYMLSEAFTMALDSTSRTKSRGDWRYYVKRFMRWLAEEYPHCTQWNLLTRQMAREYLATFAGRSANTKRLAFQPLIQTAAFMHRELGCVNFAERLGIGGKLKTTPQRVYLRDVVEFCDFLREQNPRIEVGIALQGLAGLQLQEATRLTWNRVDLEQGLIEISGEVKNEYRNRVIPVANRVLEALIRASASKPKVEAQVQELHEPVIVNSHGVSYADYGAYSKRVLKLLQEWNSRIAWKAKDFRNCLPTFAVIKGILSDVWEQYLGHAPRSITARHYIPRLASVSSGEREALGRQMQLLRLHVTEPLNEALLHEELDEKWQEMATQSPGTPAILPVSRG